MYQYLAHLAGITVKLQRATVDIVEAHEMITEVGSFYQKEREDCGTNVSRIYNESVSMAEKVGTAAEMQIDLHQDNSIAPILRPKLLESISKEKWQFLYLIILSCVSKSTSVLGLVPSVLCSRNVNLNAAVN